ncbi:hypothetical protein [Nocardia stercoris]|uniref:Uncharacterized protein n=1 Tax=Nocardia stercoris TaxID=2483361 RepID=A0A3M2LBL6_9NOCA|nr:hypothetical protein [Nocardia stercoris]RMI34917.1 hypothetical protein EBN03_00675 [Nocardia stercoris]
MRYNIPKTLAATAGVVAAACVAGPALAGSGGTQVGPAGAPFAATLSGSLSVNVGSITASCTISTASGTLPAAPANATTSGPITVNIGTPTVSGCSAPFTSISVQTSGNWTISGSYDASGITGSLNIPQNGISAQTSGLLNCGGIAPPSGPVSVPGTWTNGTDSLNNPSQVNVSGTVPVTVSGGGLCPTGSGTVVLSATYAVKDSANSAVPIIIGPVSGTPVTTTTAPGGGTGGTGSASSLPFLGPLFSSLSGGTTTTTTAPPTTTTTVPPTTTTTVPPTTTTVPRRGSLS